MRLEHNNKTNFIPIDSEHFSIWMLLNNKKNEFIEKIYITASGGPFLKYNKKKFKNIKPNQAINHPRWSMGKKISIDSSTLINKVYEVIEAQRLFNIDIEKFNIYIHPRSYLHSIIKFTNGTSQLLVHDTDMRIPIFNSIYLKNEKKIKTNTLDIKALNNLNLSKPDIKKFPSLKILKKVSGKISLYDTVVISANDELVSLFLSNQIKYSDIYKNLSNILNKQEFLKLRNKTPSNLRQILNLNKYVRLKTINQCIK